MGIFTTAGTRRPIVAKLNQWIRSALALADFRQKISTFGTEVIFSTPEQFESRFLAETPACVKMTDELGVKLD